MVMRSEQCLCAEQLRIRHMLNHRPGDRKTVERTRSSSDLIENQQTVRGCIPKNIRHLRHLNHKRTLAACQVIGCADTGKDPVHNTDVCLRSRNKRTDLCHQHNEAVWRIYVDLPAMFGPVMTETRWSPLSSRVSFAINISFGIIFSTTG